MHRLRSWIGEVEGLVRQRASAEQLLQNPQHPVIRGQASASFNLTPGILQTTGVRRTSFEREGIERLDRCDDLVEKGLVESEIDPDEPALGEERDFFV